MFATAIRRVNTRLEASTRSKKLLPLEVGETVIIKRMNWGERYRGSDLWIEDVKGNHFVAAGLTIGTKNNLSPLVDFKKIWALANFAGLKIGLIDTGVMQDPLLFKEQVHQINHGNSDITDPHGTYMASIIAGNDYKNGYAGFIPNSTIYSFKASWWNDNLPDRTVYQDFCEGLNRLLALDVDIVNISMGTYKHKAFFERDTRVKHLLDQFTQKGVPIIAATGNDSYRTDDLKFYPAGQPGMFSVSGYSTTNASVDFDSGLNLWSDVTLLCPSFQIFDADFFIKYGTNKTVGSSVAAAVATGTVGVLKLLHLKNGGGIPFIDSVQETVQSMPSILAEGGNLRNRKFRYLDFNLITTKI